MRFLFLSKEIFFIFIFGIFIICASLNLGCTYPMPKVDVTFWAGDSEKSGITRSQENKTISCSQPEFDDYGCLKYVDIQKVFSAMLQCEKWGPPLATQTEIKSLMNKNDEVIHHVLKRK